MRVQVCHDPNDGFRAVALDIIAENRDEERLLGHFSGLVSSVVVHNYQPEMRLQLAIQTKE